MSIAHSASTNSESSLGAFQPARSTRAFDDVVAQIRDAILRGDYKPGDRLPSEKLLREQFGVGRGTIREAARMLEQLGLISLRPGLHGGMFVREYGQENMSEPLGLLLAMDKISIAELNEFREQFDAHCARLAAERASPGDLEALRAVLRSCEQLAAAPEPPFDQLLDLELEFHLRIAQASGNRLNGAIMAAIRKVLRQAFNYIPPESADRLLGDMRKLTELIAAGDAAGAAACMQAHVHHFNQVEQERQRHATLGSG